MTITHGTESAYRIHGCRCETCRAGRSARYRAWTAGKRRTDPKPRTRKPTAHGTATEYGRGCRCEECRYANAVQRREYRARRRAEAGLPPAEPRRLAAAPCDRMHVEDMTRLLESRSRTLAVAVATSPRSEAGRDARARRAEVLGLLDYFRANAPP